MQTASLYPTSYPEVNEALNLLLREVQAVLGDLFIGLYIHGSLANGGFRPESSDIDFLVVTKGELPPEMLHRLREMHTRIYASGLKWTRKMEGSYIPQVDLRRYDSAHAAHPALRMDGSFEMDRHGSDWIIQRHIIRERALVMAGPPPKLFIDPVFPDDLRRGARGILQEWWLPKLSDPSYLKTNEYQAYAILTMCRILYTLEHGEVATKPAAATWAQKELGEPWAGFVELALNWNHEAAWDKLDETLEFVRFTIQKADDSVNS